MSGRFIRRYSWTKVREILSLIGAPRNPRLGSNSVPATDMGVVRRPSLAAHLRAFPGGAAERDCTASREVEM